MARIEIFAVGEVKTASNTNKYIVLELLKKNGMLTKRVKALFFEKDIDIEAAAASKKGDLFGIGEISTVKVQPYEAYGKEVTTATLFIQDGDELEACLAKKKMSRAVAAPAPVMTLESTTL